jgi:hypothetical protein
MIIHEEQKTYFWLKITRMREVASAGWMFVSRNAIFSIDRELDPPSPFHANGRPSDNLGLLHPTIL